MAMPQSANFLYARSANFPSTISGRISIVHNLWRLCINRKELSIKLANINRELTNEENQNLFEEVKNIDGQPKHTSKLTSWPLDVNFYINHIEKKNIYSYTNLFKNKKNHYNIIQKEYSKDKLFEKFICSSAGFRCNQNRKKS